MKKIYLFFFLFVFIFNNNVHGGFGIEDTFKLTYDNCNKIIYNNYDVIDTNLDYGKSDCFFLKGNNYNALQVFQNKDDILAYKYVVNKLYNLQIPYEGLTLKINGTITGGNMFEGKISKNEDNVTGVFSLSFIEEIEIINNNYSVNIEPKKTLEENLLLTNINNKYKNQLDDIFNNFSNNPKKLITIYNKVKKSKEKIKGNNNRKYRKIYNILKYIEYKVGILIHNNSEIEKNIINTIKMNKDEYFLVDFGGQKTLLKFNGYSLRKGPNDIEGELTPSITIYPEYEDGKFFQILSTFIPYNNDDGYRYRINGINFGYKMISYDKINNSIELNLLTESNSSITGKINKILFSDLNQYDIFTKYDLDEELTNSIIKKLSIK